MPPEINTQRTEDDQPNVSKSFWKSATDIIKATEKHEFLTKMVNGSLPIENFKYYIIQDSLYLADFADGLYRLARTPDIPKEDKNRLEKFAVDAREAEMSLHNGFFKKWNVDAKDAKAMPNTVLYCSNMLRVVSTRCYAEGLAALLPCFWIYMHMGKVMLKHRDELGDSVQRCEQYNEWIDMYASDQFESDVNDYINMVNAAAANASQITILQMEEHFIMSCKLEYMFWDQGLQLMEWPSFPQDGGTVSCHIWCTHVFYHYLNGCRYLRRILRVLVC